MVIVTFIILVLEILRLNKVTLIYIDLFRSCTSRFIDSISRRSRILNLFIFKN